MRLRYATGRYGLVFVLVGACAVSPTPPCQRDADCATGQVCVGAPGVCLIALRDAGALPQDAGVDAGTAADGAPPLAGRLLDAGVYLPGETCQNAVPVIAGEYPAQSTVGYRNDYSGATRAGRCTQSDRGLDRVYAIVVPAGQRLRASVAPEIDSGGYDPSVYLIRGPGDRCEVVARECLSADDTGPRTQTNVAWHHNEGTADETVFIVVDAFDSSDEGGQFTLSVALDAAVEGDECESAPRIGAGLLAGQSTRTYSNRYFGGVNANGCTTSTGGRDRAYAVQVPNGQQLTVTATPAGGFDPSLSLIAGPASTCDVEPRICLASTDSGPAGAAETLRWTNRSGGDMTVFVLVDSAAADTGGDFELLVAMEGPPAGDLCANAPLIGAGVYSGQSTTGLSNDYSGASNGVNGCTSSDRGLDRAYAVELPAGTRLTASVQPDDATSEYDPSITLVAGPASNCDVSPRVCLAADDFGVATYLNVVQHTNTSAAPQTVYIIIDNWAPADTGGTFTLTTTLDVP